MRMSCPTNNDDRVEAARKQIAAARYVVFFTGAGISAESGISTFRGAADGIWDKYPPDEFANLPGLLRVASRRPKLFASFLHDFIEPLVLAEPNQAHRAIAAFQHRNSSTIVTQNVDTLHQRGGASRVIELHGSMFESLNLVTKAVRKVSMPEMESLVSRLKALKSDASSQFSVYRALSPLLRLRPSGLWLPNVVLFGQSLPKRAWYSAVEAVEGCDCLVIVGTSRQVFPAAALVDIARARGIAIVDVDLAASDSELSFRGSACSILPRLCA